MTGKQEGSGDLFLFLKKLGLDHETDSRVGHFDAGLALVPRGHLPNAEQCPVFPRRDGGVRVLARCPECQSMPPEKCAELDVSPTAAALPDYL